MPIRNEANYIARSLSAVLAQDYPAALLDILVIDGLSVDRTREIVQQMYEFAKSEADTSSSSSAELPSLVILDNPAGIVPNALNIGLRHTRADVIVRVDGHCEIASDYVRRCVEALRETGADNVGGVQRAVGHGWMGRAVALATSSRFGVGNAQFHYAEKAGWVDTVYLGAYRRDVFERIGGFDEELVRNQDDEFNFRLLQAKGRIWLDPTIRSLYYGRVSLRRLWRQYFQYGYYKVRVIQKRGSVPSWRHLVPGMFVLGLIGSVLLSLFTGQLIWVVSFAGVYVIANILASLSIARRDWHMLPVLPLVFLTLHLAYGVGFLRGIWHWTHIIKASPIKAET